MDNGMNNVNDIVAMLDSMVANDHGHINISYDPEQEGMTEETLGCLDCAKGNLACAVPTLHEGIDEGLED